MAVEACGFEKDDDKEQWLVDVQVGPQWCLLLGGLGFMVVLEHGSLFIYLFLNICFWFDWVVVLS